MSKLIPRKIDHIVLPVPDLDVARARYSKLGFIVADDARHSFGTENCCVNFKNGTFLEPLAIGHRETVEANEIKGNTFLRRDAAYRFRKGENGFSMAVFLGKDAHSERKNFTKLGYNTGKLVKVKRPGLSVTAAFVMDERAPDASLFLIERPDGTPNFPKSLTGHENGALALARITMYEPVPSDFQYYLQQVTGQRDPNSHSFGLDFQTPNGILSVMNRYGLRGFYGIERERFDRGLEFVAFDILVGSLDQTASILKANKVDYKKIGPRLVVQPAEGQGAVLAFVEK